VLDSKGVSDYWEEQTKKGDNPCHYHNKWQDAYAFDIRTQAFKRSDFAGASRVVDVGCGIGEYTEEISKLTDAHIDAFDFPFNIDIALRERGTHPRITFHTHPVPSAEMEEAIRNADRAFTTTVYVHFSREARDAFYAYVQQMKLGSRVMLLEYIPDEIPEFQKGLPYKEVETVSTITEQFAKAGFIRRELRHINFIDSFLFFHLGKNAFVYHLTKALERILQLVGYTHSKYKLLVFEKQ
jgi:trans-aconitate methyltransferase